MKPKVREKTRHPSPKKQRTDNGLTRDPDTGVLGLLKTAIILFMKVNDQESGNVLKRLMEEIAATLH